MRTILYARVSTKEQTLDHQVTQAKAAGFTIDEVIADHGVSGVSTKLADRPQGRRLFDLLRAGDTLVVRWVDRLGRNYEDVTSVMREFIRRGVIIRTVVNGMLFDGASKDPMHKAVVDAQISFMSALAQAQADAMQEARLAGIAHAKAQEDAGRKYRGRRPSFTRKQVSQVVKMFGEGAGTSDVARTAGLSRQTVLRIKADPEAAAKSLALWERSGSESASAG